MPIQEPLLCQKTSFAQNFQGKALLISFLSLSFHAAFILTDLCWWEIACCQLFCLGSFLRQIQLLLARHPFPGWWTNPNSTVQFPCTIRFRWSSWRQSWGHPRTMWFLHVPLDWWESQILLYVFYLPLWFLLISSQLMFMYTTTNWWLGKFSIGLVLLASSYTPPKMIIFSKQLLSPSLDFSITTQASLHRN